MMQYRSAAGHALRGTAANGLTTVLVYDGETGVLIAAGPPGRIRPISDPPAGSVSRFDRPRVVTATYVSAEDDDPAADPGRAAEGSV